MLSKSKGQTLCVAATKHALFHWKTPDTIPAKISDDSLKAAVSFVDLYINQHAAFLVGCTTISEEIELIPDQYWLDVFTFNTGT